MCMSKAYICSLAPVYCHTVNALRRTAACKCSRRRLTDNSTIITLIHSQSASIFTVALHHGTLLTSPTIECTAACRMQGCR